MRKKGFISNIPKNPFDEPSTGLEIKDWIWYNSHTETRYSSLAKRMGAFFNLNDNKKYILTLCDDIPKATEITEKENANALSCDNC